MNKNRLFYQNKQHLWNYCVGATFDCLRRWLSNSAHERPKMAFPNDQSVYGKDPMGWERLVDRQVGVEDTPGMWLTVMGRRKEPKLESDQERKCLVEDVNTTPG